MRSTWPSPDRRRLDCCCGLAGDAAPDRGKLGRVAVSRRPRWAPDTPVTELAAEMVRPHAHRIIVVENDRPADIASSLDMTALIAGSARK